MTENQINKHQKSMVRKFLWWSLWNKDKMEKQDWMLCFSHTLDIIGFIGLGLFLAKVTKNFLFRTDFIGIEHVMQSKGFNIYFYKALFAYSTASIFTYCSLRNIVQERYMVDLAYEYKFNFQNDLSGSGIDEMIN